jgi:phosphoglycerate dehydrogenase-like enzyme
MKTYRIGVSRDLVDAAGQPMFDPVAFDVLKGDPALEWEWFGDGARGVTADEIAAYDGICLGAPPMRAAALGRGDQRARIIARFGAGFDYCDVDALTRAGILLTTNPGGVRRSVATSALAFILALAHRIPTLDRQVRENRWDERMNSVGTGLAGKTLGLIGVGNIGQEIFRLVQPLDMRHMACDPFAKAEDLAPLGVALAGFDAVVAQSDFLIVSCPLDETTRGLVGARAFGLMKPSAFLINTARGAIVDEAALYQALKTRRIAGAALDVFEKEPTPPDNPLLTLDNVILSPHTMSYTDESLRLLAEGGFRAARAFFDRKTPFKIINAEVLETLAMKAWFRSPAGG